MAKAKPHTTRKRSYKVNSNHHMTKLKTIKNRRGHMKGGAGDNGLSVLDHIILFFASIFHELNVLITGSNTPAPMTADDLTADDIANLGKDDD